MTKIRSGLFVLFLKMIQIQLSMTTIIIGCGFLQRLSRKSLYSYFSLIFADLNADNADGNTLNFHSAKICF